MRIFLSCTTPVRIVPPFYQETCAEPPVPLRYDAGVNAVVSNALNLPFVQVALPILAGFMTINWSQNKRMDEMSKRLDIRFDSIERRLYRI